MPFGEHCRFHGGNTVRERERARLAVVDYEAFSTDPPWRKKWRLDKWQESQDRWEMRKARKRGPEFVAALLRERAAAKATRQWEVADNRRVRAERRREATQNYRRAKGLPEPPEPGSGVEVGSGFEYVGQPTWD